MGRIFTAVLLGIEGLCGGAKADIIVGTQRNVLGWTLAAYDRDEGKFSHCGMDIPYKSGITMHYSIFANYTWRVGWAHPSWNLTTGQQVWASHDPHCGCRSKVFCGCGSSGHNRLLRSGA